VRLWSLHPRFLDARGLVALWREGLLARAVLLGRTRGYRSHPQLARFLARRDPVAAVDCYLSRVLDEARARGYAFDDSKIRYRSRCRHRAIPVTSGQLMHEWAHLLGKLAVRDRGRWRSQRKAMPQANGCFRVVDGPPAPWERRRIGERTSPGRGPSEAGEGWNPSPRVASRAELRSATASGDPRSRGRLRERSSRRGTQSPPIRTAGGR